MELKKIILLLALYFGIVANNYGQNIAIGIHTGWATHISSSTVLGIPVGINAEWAYNGKHGIAGRANFNIGPRKEDINLYYVSPEYKYYITGEVLDGFYTGGFTGFGGGEGTAYISFGGLLGYSYSIIEKLNLEANLQLGYGNFLENKVSVLHIMPTIGFRYAL